MPLLSWEKPPRKVSVEDWKSISADAAPPGVYTPNMSKADELKWKAKLVGRTIGKPRVEVRKSTDNGVQLLIVVSPDSIRVSMNGSAQLSNQDWDDLNTAVGEAQAALKKLTP